MSATNNERKSQRLPAAWARLARTASVVALTAALTYVVHATPAESATPPPGDRALVIGIDHYADARLNLAGAVRDAHNIRGLLTEHLGFAAEQVRVLTNQDATREGILTAIREWLVVGRTIF